MSWREPWGGRSGTNDNCGTKKNRVKRVQSGWGEEAEAVGRESTTYLKGDNAQVDVRRFRVRMSMASVHLGLGKKISKKRKTGTESPIDQGLPAKGETHRTRRVNLIEAQNR